MQIADNVDLTYCTNIHPGETWEEVFRTLQAYVPPLRQALAPGQPFGIGLRLPNAASLELMQPGRLAAFAEWLTGQDAYVSIINGFPYGSFHRQRVKDEVLRPDWTTTDRYEYTIRLARILAQLLPEGMDGGVSTSPITYRHWHEAGEQEKMLKKACLHLAAAIGVLHQIRQETGKLIHLDIEPEPDGWMDTTANTIAFFKEQFIPRAVTQLQVTLGLHASAAQEVIGTHLQLCYDVCHFAVMHEDPATALQQLEQAGIRIGRAQISAALKAEIPSGEVGRQALAAQFGQFADSVYLHQVAARMPDGTIAQFGDLPPALETLATTRATQWRSHFHVPVFVRDYGLLQSTQDDIVKVLQLQREKPFTRHLEVETYTWEVLPADLKLDLTASIRRELEWVLNQWKQP